ncbi:MAG: hypothetical protein ABI605_04870 [Rhizobacter sp.]
MTDSQNKGQSQEIIYFCLAKAGDELAINALLAEHPEAKSSRSPRTFSASDDNSKERFTLMAYRPSGEVLASLRLELVRTQEELDEALGEKMWPCWVGDFPIVALTHVCPLEASPYLRILRLVSLIVADVMSVDGKKVEALLNPTTSARALARYASSVHASTSIGINKLHFSDAISALLENASSNWKWVSDLPFASHLPKDMNHLGLAMFTQRTYRSTTRG